MCHTDSTYGLRRRNLPIKNTGPGEIKEKHRKWRDRDGGREGKQELGEEFRYKWEWIIKRPALNIKRVGRMQEKASRNAHESHK